jgi:3-oxoacyl-[acyl-carrier protein] reductase
MAELQGKNSFVSGGSRGIGAAIALKLAEQGANVTITYSKSQDLANAVIQKIEAKGVKGLAIQADAMEAQNVVQAIQQAVSAFGAINILINNAAIFEMKSITESTLEDYERTENVKSMPEKGRIITIGSVNSGFMPFPGGSLYAMSKAAVRMMTQSWARDLGERKITANVIQPGPIDTDMNPADGQFGETLTAMTAIKRYGQAEEVAEIAAFLSSPKASNITGSAINIDGGLSV